MARTELLAAAASVLLAACASTTSVIPDGWMSVPPAPRITALGLGETGAITSTPLTKSQGWIRVEGGRIWNGEKSLTEPFSAIDSFDFSSSRGEVVFSAKRTDNFDVGLVSSDGSPIVWIPSPDPSDEIAVQWAPRGNKISYIVRAKGGDVVRTVHIPTSSHLATDFPGGTIHALAWDPQAEHYAVAYSTLDTSDRVEVLKYDGTSRKVVSPPAATLDADIEPIAKDAFLLRPRDIRYDEKLPLVVWTVGDFSWSDARAALMRNARVAMIVTKGNTAIDVKERPWIDGSRTFLVNARELPGEGQIAIRTDATLPANRYRRTANVVSVPPAVIESFSAGFIADALKRTAAAHGRR